MRAGSREVDVLGCAVLHEQAATGRQQATRLGKARHVVRQVVNQCALEHHVAARRGQPRRGGGALHEADVVHARASLAARSHHLRGEIHTRDLGGTQRMPGQRVKSAAAADVGNSLADRFDKGVHGVHPGGIDVPAGVGVSVLVCVEINGHWQWSMAGCTACDAR